MRVLTALVSALALCFVGGSAQAQPVDTEVVDAAGSPEQFVPADFGILEFEEPEDLYDQLIASGRCPVGHMAAERQPCAFIYYELTSGAGKRMLFKPVFKVQSRTVVWAMHNKKLAKISVDQLYHDVVVVKGERGTYRSFAVVGNAENEANCTEGRKCLRDLVQENMFLMYETMPDMIVQLLWHNRRIDPGTNVIRRQ